MTKGNKKGFLTREEQQQIAHYKKNNPEATYKEIAEKFKVTERQVFNAVHFYSDISGVEKRTRADEELLKKIAIYKSNHPLVTLEQLEKKFNVPMYTARYALQKYAGEANLGKATAKGRAMQSKLLADTLDETEALRHQLRYALAELENNPKIVISVRTDLLYKLVRLRVYLQDLEIESHIKRVDADVIAMIIRRFLPNATNDDIIKIYTEEFHKWQTHKGQLGKGF